MPTAAPDDDVARRIGRFAVVATIGRGGMSVVYAVYDEHLDRRVALKLLERDASDDLGARLRREARALARLSHPNVVPVFEVGQHDGRMFLVMEYVEGQTLRQWLRVARPTAAEVIEKYAQAGRGLAAAHAADMVHRDFKPENAMVDVAGRARVLDFGLARWQRESPTVHGAIEASTAASELELTATGAIVGTPAYMAPEQMMLGQCDHRSDQFSFCVALWEALCSERPFAGETLTELALSTSAGVVRPPPRSSALPGWLRPLLERGLAPTPDARWPSLAALLDEIDRRRRPRRWPLRVALAGLGGALAFALAVKLSHEPGPCATTADPVGSVWDDAMRVRLRALVLGSGSALAATTWPRLERSLDDAHAMWLGERRDACEATHVRHESSERALDLRNACLDRRARELGALIERLAANDGTEVASFAGAVARLPDPRGCTDADERERRPPPTDPDARAAYDAATELIADARATQALGEYARAITRADRAASIEYLDLAAEAASIAATSAFSIDRPDVGTRLELAVVAADAAGDDRLRLELLSRQVDHAVGRGASSTEIPAHVKQLAAVATRLGGGPYERGVLAFAESRLAESDRDWTSALAKAEVALAELEQSDESTLVEDTLHQLAKIELELGRFDQALAHTERAERSGAERLGPDHPELIARLAMRAQILEGAQRFGEAEGLYRVALMRMLVAFGPDHRDVAAVWVGLGNTLHMLGRNAGAADAYDRALRIYGDDDHPFAAMTRGNLAMALAAIGRADEARQVAAQMITRIRELRSGDDPLLAEALRVQGYVLSELGDAAAIDAFEQAIAIYDRIGGQEPLRQSALVGLADARTRLGAAPVE
jgi:tetratricopeptide (TPR) repeat protein/predicted Ser/Thr protein kinase